MQSFVVNNFMDSKLGSSNTYNFFKEAVSTPTEHDQINDTVQFISYWHAWKLKDVQQLQISWKIFKVD